MIRKNEPQQSETLPAKQAVAKHYSSHLSAEQCTICWNKAAEPQFSGKYTMTKDRGIYNCGYCGSPLFSSGTKFDSGMGWPSFCKLASKDNVHELSDQSSGMIRTVVSAKFGAHLGHVFDYGPMQTGLCYCINTLSLDLARGATFERT